MAEDKFEWKNWWPMPLQVGPPLPRWLGITWPWYKPEEVPPGEFKLTIEVVGNGAVTPGSGNFPAGSTVTLTAIPDSGSAFVNWDGDAYGTESAVNIVMDKDKSVTAYFSVVTPPPYEEPEEPEPPPEEVPEEPPAPAPKPEVPVIPPSSIGVELRNPPYAAYWRAVVMNGGIFYPPGYFELDKVIIIKVPTDQIGYMKTFACLVYDEKYKMIERRDVSPHSGFTLGTHYYYDWAANIFDKVA